MMNVYFSCSITGGRADQSVYAEIVAILQANGCIVPTAHLASPDLAQLETDTQAEEIYQRDIAWVRACDALIAEVSTPSHGVGYEIAEAVKCGKRVLCLYREGAHVSKILTGNTEENFKIQVYKDHHQLQEAINSFLSQSRSANFRG
jgi:nucleoside 2-deoxyribosyltransferase